MTFFSSFFAILSQIIDYQYLIIIHFLPKISIQASFPIPDASSLANHLPPLQG